MSEITSKIGAECLRIEEDAEHSFKGHYNAAARWGLYHLSLGIPSALAAAIAGATAFKNMPNYAGWFALTSTALTTILTFINPSELSEKHKSAAGKYQTLRNQTRLFREIELASLTSDEQAGARLIELTTMRDNLNQTSPAINRNAYELAKADIDDGRSRYRVDGIQA